MLLLNDLNTVNTLNKFILKAEISEIDITKPQLLKIKMFTWLAIGVSEAESQFYGSKENSISTFLHT